ncbi:MAG: hypothetical protein FJ350_05875, partial [Sphingomonadales bacterium]|nr:hypothetical protein [Sphingomonadales bacterium]
MATYTLGLRLWMRRITLFLVILLEGYAVGYASDSTKNAPSGWTLEECVRYALEHNLSLQQGA